MSFILHPWQLLLVILAGWVHQQQQQIIEFQRTEINVLKDKLGKSGFCSTMTSVDGCREGENSGPEGIGRNWRSLHAGYDSALAPRVGGSEMGLQ